MCTHNICFYGEVSKNYPGIITKYSSLTIPLVFLIYVLQVPFTCSLTLQYKKQKILEEKKKREKSLG